MNFKHPISSCLIFLLITTSAFSESFKTRYSIVVYDNDELLEDFNDNLVISRKLSVLFKNRKNITLEDEVRNKVDVIVEKVEVVLEMFPNEIEFKLILLEDEDDVKKQNKSKRLTHKKLVGLFNPKTFEMFISVDDVDLKVFSHEVGHMIIESYFEVTPPVITHELMAQYAASRIAN